MMEVSAEVEMENQNEDHADSKSLTFEPTKTVCLDQFTIEPDETSDKVALDLSTKKPLPSNHNTMPLATPTNQDIATGRYGNHTVTRGNQVQPTYNGACSDSPPVVNLSTKAALPGGNTNSSRLNSNRTISEARQDTPKTIMHIPPGSFHENNDSVVTSGRHEGGFTRIVPHSKDGKCARVAPQVRGPGAVAMDTTQQVNSDLTHHLLPVSSRQTKWTPVVVRNHPSTRPISNALAMETGHKMITIETNHSKPEYVLPGNKTGNHGGGLSAVAWQHTGIVNSLPKGVASQQRFEPRSHQDESEPQSAVAFATAEPYSSLHLNLQFIDRENLTYPKEEDFADICGFVSEELQENSSEVLHYYCSFCSYKTTDQETFTEHILLHMFVCKYCGYLTYSRFFHLVHLQRCHPHLGYDLKNYQVCRVQISASSEQRGTGPDHDGEMYIDEDAVVPQRGAGMGPGVLSPRDHPRDHHQNAPAPLGRRVSTTTVTSAFPILREQSCQTDSDGSQHYKDSTRIPVENGMHFHNQAQNDGQRPSTFSALPQILATPMAASVYRNQTHTRGTQNHISRQDSKIDTAAPSGDACRPTFFQNMSGGGLVPKSEQLSSCERQRSLNALPKKQIFQSPRQFDNSTMSVRNRHEEGNNDDGRTEVGRIPKQTFITKDERTLAVDNDKRCEVLQREGASFQSTSLHMVNKPQIQSGGAVIESRSHLPVSQSERMLSSSSSSSPPLAHQRAPHFVQKGEEKRLPQPPPAHSNPASFPSISQQHSFILPSSEPATAQAPLVTDTRGHLPSSATMTGQLPSPRLHNERLSSEQTFHHNKHGRESNRGVVVKSGHLSSVGGGQQLQQQVFKTSVAPASHKTTSLINRQTQHILEPAPPARPAVMAMPNTATHSMPGAVSIGMMPVVNPQFMYQSLQFRMPRPQLMSPTLGHFSGDTSKTSGICDKVGDQWPPINIKREPQDVIELEDGVLDLSIKDKPASKAQSGTKSGSAYAAPSAGTAYTAPSSGTAYTAPSSGTAYTAPSAGTAYTAPSAGTAYTAPSAGTACTAPSAGTAYTVPSLGGSQNPDLPPGLQFLPAVSAVNMLPAQGSMFSFSQQQQQHMMSMHRFMPGPVNPTYPMMAGTFNPPHLMLPAAMNASMSGSINPTVSRPINPSIPCIVNNSAPGSVNHSVPITANPSAMGSINPSFPRRSEMGQTSQRPAMGGTITLAPGAGHPWAPQPAGSNNNNRQVDKGTWGDKEERVEQGESERRLEVTNPVQAGTGAREEDPSVQSAAEIILNLGRDKIACRQGEDMVRKRPGLGMDTGQFVVKNKRRRMSDMEAAMADSHNSSPSVDHHHDNRILFRSYSDSGHFRNQDDPPPLLTPGTPQGSLHPSDTPPRLFNALADPAGGSTKRGPGRPPKHLRNEGGDSDQGSPGGGEGKTYAKRGPKPGHCTRGPLLWQFIRDLLKNSTYCPRIIKWENQKDGVFRIIQSEEVAKLWGRKKSNPIMTYENLSRAIRFARTAGYFADLPKGSNYPKKLCFKFGHKAFGWEEEEPSQWPANRLYRRAMSETPGDNYHHRPSPPAQPNLNTQNRPQNPTKVPFYTTPMVEPQGSAVAVAQELPPGGSVGQEELSQTANPGGEPQNVSTQHALREPPVAAGIPDHQRFLPSSPGSLWNRKEAVGNPESGLSMQDFSSHGATHLSPRGRDELYSSTINSGQSNMQTAESSSGNNYGNTSYPSSSSSSQGQGEGHGVQGQFPTSSVSSFPKQVQVQDQQTNEVQVNRFQDQGQNNVNFAISQGHMQGEGHSKVSNMARSQGKATFDTESPCLYNSENHALDLASRSPQSTSGSHQVEQRTSDDQMEGEIRSLRGSSTDSAEKAAESQPYPPTSTENNESVSMQRYDAQTSTDFTLSFTIKKEIDP